MGGSVPPQGARKKVIPISNQSYSVLADTLSCCLVLGPALKGLQSIYKNASGEKLTSLDKTLLTILPALTGAVIWVVYFCDFSQKFTN